MRADLRLREGDGAILVKDHQGARLTTRATLIEAATGSLAREDGRDLTEELLSERRQDAGKKGGVRPPLLLGARTLITLFRPAPGDQEVRRALSERPCAVSSVTVAETKGKRVVRGDSTYGQVQEAWGKPAPFVPEWVFDADCRAKAAFCSARKSPYGLSLGDTACLGTAEVHRSC